MTLVTMKSDAVNYIWTNGLLVAIFFLYLAQINLNERLECAADMPINFMENCVDDSQFPVDRNTPYDKDESQHYMDLYDDMFLTLVLQCIPILIWSVILSQSSCRCLKSFLDGLARNKSIIGFDERVTQMHTRNFKDLIENSDSHNFWKKMLVARCYLGIKVLFCIFPVYQVFQINNREGCSLYEGIILMTLVGDSETLTRYFPTKSRCEYTIMDPSKLQFEDKYATCQVNANHYAARMFRVMCALHLVLSIYNALILLERLRRNSTRQIDHWLNELRPTEDTAEFDRQKLLFKEEFLGEDGIFFLELMGSKVDSRAAGVICRKAFLDHMEAVE